ncbi:MAG: PD-(D/E)XK nuclease family protein, partial [Patulibacter sp.]|nr:PD-(D/E)XK nuclease family protein [Patulibacter sp.]
PDEEAALIAEHVAAAIDRGVPAERIAVAVGEPARQGPPIAAALSRAGLPAYLGAARAAAASPSIAALLGLLRAADDGSPRDLVDWLAGPGAPGGLGAADALDALSRRRGASSATEAQRLWKYLGHGDLAEFDDLLALRRAARPSTRREDRDGRHADRDRSAAVPAAFERAIVAALRARAGAAMRDPSALGASAQRDLRVVAKVVAVIDDLVAMIDAEPDPTVQHGLSLGLGELRELIAGVPAPLDEQPAGSVAIVGPLDVRSRYVDVLVIARAQAGSYPATEPVRRVLTPRDRASLAELGWPRPTRPDHRHAERYLAYEVVARPTRQLFLAWHDGDGDGKPCEPSPLLAEVRRAAEHPIPVYAMPSGSAARHAHEAERLERLTVARAGRRHRERAPDQSPVLAAQERDRYAVGALQTASRCPAQWFVDHHLRPRPLSPDAAPLTAGRLRHEVLAEVVGRVVMQRGVKLAPEALPALREELAAAAARLAPATPAPGETPEPGRRVTETLAERLMRERVVAEIDATLPALCGTKQLEHQPAELELAFGTTPRGAPADDPAADATPADGDDDLRPPVTVERGGERLVLAGRIDRLDVSSSGELVVVDYKGANVDPYKGQGWVENRELQAGLYALAAEQLMGGGTRAVASLYQPVPGPSGQAARGASAEPLADRGPMSRNDRLDPETWDELLDALVELAGDAQRSIDDGVVAPDPTRCSAGGCRYPWLCREVQA